MKLLLIADVHNKPRGSKKTLMKIKNAVNTLDCDLTVFLGDFVHGPDVKRDYEKYLQGVLDTTCGKPFAAVFGNHDEECEIGKDEILSIMQSYPGCMTAGRDYVLEMMGETLAFVDSGAYYDGEGSFYDTVKARQIDFIKNKIRGKRAILFQHIIVPDIMELIDELNAPAKGAVFDLQSWYRFKDGVGYSGALAERPCPPDINTGEFKFLAPYLKAACFGHDHKNSFELTMHGVKLIQCPGSGNNSYDKFCRSAVKILDTVNLETQTVYL